MTSGDDGDLPPGFELSLNCTGPDPLPETELRRALGRVLAQADADVHELSVTFLADAEIRGLNARWLGHDWVPDVLSFPLGPPLLGDVYVGYDQAVRQAAEHGVPVEEELVRLAVHGTLHLLGHDHPEDPDGRQCAEMTRIQEAVVREVFG